MANACAVIPLQRSRFLLLVTVALVVTAAAPVPAETPAHAVAGAERVKMRPKEPGYGLDAAFRRASAKAVADAASHSLLGTLGVPVDEPPQRKVSDYYTQAGDLDRDGVSDLLVDRSDVTDGCCTSSAIAVSGNSGSTLWSRTLADQFSSGAVPANVGPSGHAGVLLVDVTRSYKSVDEISMTLTALNGGGSQLWAARVSGVLVEQPLGFDAVHASGIPIAAFLGDVDGDGADDVRVMVADQLLEGTVLAELSVASVVVDGATGAVSGRSAEIQIDGALAFERLPDITGDALRDIAVLDVTAEGTTVRGLDAASASQVWRVEELDLYSFYVYDEYVVVLIGDVFSSVGDITGDGVVDVAVTQWNREGEFTFDSVVDGVTGEHGLRSDGSSAYPLGDSDGDGQAEVGLAGLYQGFDGAYYVRYDVARFDGSIQRRADYHVPAGRLTEAWLGFGEADGDGTTDALHRLASDGGADRAVISGATATRLWEPPPNGYLLRSLDGTGVDFLATTRGDEGAVILDARDGASGTELWRQTLPLPSGATFASVQTVDLDEDGRHELLVHGSCAEVNCRYNIIPEMRLLDPSDGSERWVRTD